MVTYLPRSAWNARPPNGRTLLVASSVKGIALHHPGTTSTKPIVTQAAVASALRGYQNFHMDDKGWSDIAYQVAVDQAGRAWDLRGLGMKSAANGDGTVNAQYGAILLMLVEGEAVSAAMKATVRGVVTDFRKRFPRGTLVVGHRDIRPGGTPTQPSTTCPGPEAYAVLKAGGFTPTTEDDVTPEQLAAILAGSTKAEAAAKAASSAVAALDKRLDKIEAAIPNSAEAAGRRWALYQLRYGLQTEDERSEAQKVYNDAIASGDSQEQAMAKAVAILQPLDDALRETQGRG